MTPSKRSEQLQKLSAAQHLVDEVRRALQTMPEAAADPVKAVVDELEHLSASIGGCGDQIRDRRFARAGGKS